MPRFSRHFGLRGSQAELDFVDVELDRDNKLFVDPFAVSQRLDRWGQDAHAVLVAFFQLVIDRIRAGKGVEARQLLSQLREPNETRLGLSRAKPRGAGIGSGQADELYGALCRSQAVKTGFISSLEECELMIEGFGHDKISDLTTNILRGKLAAYTQDQCVLHGVPVREVSVGPTFNMDSGLWINDYLRLPVRSGRPIILVPKSIARYKPAYNHESYYRHFALDFLQSEHLRAGSALVHTLRNGKRKVYKKELEQRYPCTKSFLFEFSKEHPEVLAEYRDELSRMEVAGPRSVVDEDDERILAGALRRAVANIEIGNAAASEYHRLMVGILEFVFFPKLLGPRKEVEIHEGRKRIDIVMENAAPSGIFNRLHAVRGIPCSFIFFECKNYGREIANPEMDQISGRFSTNRGRVGFICCRRFDKRALFVKRCRDTFVDGRGLVVAVDDSIVDGLLNLIQSDRREEIDTEIGRLVDEVFLT